MKILLVEDDEFIGESIKDYLELQDNRVDYYPSPLNALEEVYPSHYDIFLLDINMPEMNGYEFYEELKRYASDVPVIFITAYSDIQHIEKAFEVGAADYIKKPFELRELELRIKRLVFKKTNRIKITKDYEFDVKNLKLFIVMALKVYIFMLIFGTKEFFLLKANLHFEENKAKYMHE